MKQPQQPRLKTLLKKKLNNAQKIAVLGIGSELRGDDVAGMLASQLIDEACKKSDNPNKIKVFYGATAPENFSGEIKKFKPTHLIMIDAVNVGKQTGYICLIELDDIGGISFSTHQLPLNIFADYLKQTLKCEVIIIGIQPATLEFSAPVSKEITFAAQNTADMVIKYCN